MKTGLHLSLGQSLTMTPQLQQAIRLLQLSTLELQQEVQQALDGNPLLELDNDEPAGSLTGEASAQSVETEGADTRDLDLDHQSELPHELPVDTAWDDIYTPATGSDARHDDDDRDEFDGRHAQEETLQDHLRWQLNLTPFSPVDRLIAETLIDALDERGYLGCSLDDVIATLAHVAQATVEEDEVLAVLHRLQHFDPTGVAARTLPECLLVQLRQRDPETPGRAAAIAVLTEHADKIAQSDLASLARRVGCSLEDMQAGLVLLRTLKPHPGTAWRIPDQDRALIPDVVVRKIGTRWRVELNPEATPRLRVHAGYASLLRRADSSSDNQFIKDHLQEARFLIKSLHSRHETLLRVASCIVTHQRGFLDEGPEAMRPLVLREVADELGLHESTISRVTTQKFLLTPRGLFELKYFFSSHVGTQEGGEASSTAIRAILRKLISQEDPRKPLSDSRLADLLADQGLDVARRTVAKYRESMNIPSSGDRKRLL